MVTLAVPSPEQVVSSGAQVTSLTVFLSCAAAGAAAAVVTVLTTNTAASQIGKQRHHKVQGMQHKHPHLAKDKVAGKVALCTLWQVLYIRQPGSHTSVCAQAKVSSSGVCHTRCAYLAVLLDEGGGYLALTWSQCQNKDADPRPSAAAWNSRGNDFVKGAMIQVCCLCCAVTRHNIE